MLLLYVALTLIPLILNVSPVKYEVFVGGFIKVSDDTSSFVTVIVKEVLFPAYDTVTVFVPAVLISGLDKVTLLVTSAVLLLLYFAVTFNPVESNLSPV